jgi:steroid delta-isomerase
VIEALGRTSALGIEPSVVMELPMSENTNSEIRHVYERWHENVVTRNLDGLMELYDENATLESPLVLAVLKEREAGILKGKQAIASFFARGFQSPENGLGRWYRTGTFFSNGRQLTWEYPRDTPQGDQVDLVEVMDLANGLIAHHRVYWGWVGFKALVATSSKPAS